MQLKTVNDLGEVDAEQWNALDGGIDDPFVRHEFLHGLELHGCVGDQWGWYPHHQLLYDCERLVGAAPLYLKDNSYGELVFDWAWADAYRRAGLNYYPKAVVAVPYSPVTGSRLLLADDIDRTEGEHALIQGAVDFAREQQLSSLHWLFPSGRDCEALEREGLMRRTGTQFHWFNRGYRDFDDYLATMASKKRKNIKRERRRVVEHGIEIERHDGHSAGEEQWDAFYRFYRSTFDKRGGYATLSDPFFRHLGRTLPDSVVLLLARYQGRYVAGALSLRSGSALYGRHWGCDADFHSLHFELCYYQGLDYAIEHGLERFEPGAQGEHKVARGFEPVPTWSNHWLDHPAFTEAVSKYLDHETEMMEAYMGELREHLPYKEQQS